MLRTPREVSEDRQVVGQPIFGAIVGDSQESWRHAGCLWIGRGESMELRCCSLDPGDDSCLQAVLVGHGER